VAPITANTLNSPEEIPEDTVREEVGRDEEGGDTKPQSSSSSMRIAEGREEAMVTKKQKDCM
jgi:hypothetical protein